MSDGRTVLGPSVEIEGEVTGEDDLVIQGSIQGRILSKGHLTIEKSGVVEASVETKNLTVSGRLQGNVTASDKVEVNTDGTMIGDIRAPRVLLTDGAKFKGHIDMDVD